MTSSSILIVVMAASLAVVSAQDGICYAQNSQPYLNFATKTAYEHVYNKRGISPVPECKAQQLWLVSRHGTRWPSADDIPEFEHLNEIKNHVISNYNANKGTLCIKDIENLKAWHVHLTPEQGDQLTTQGRQDLYFLGRRIRSYFPELFENTDYSPDKFLLRHTDTARTKESAEYFYKGVFGLKFEDTIPNPLPPATADDRLIYPYNNCPAWDSQGPQSKVEQGKFIKGEHMEKVIHSVSQRLGFSYNLTHANVKEIYDGCRYQKAWNVTGNSAWCAAFKKEELEVMEYAEDLKYYYKSGPGNNMNLRLACPLVKDLYDRFSQVESQPPASNPLGVFYFTHATMLNMLSARLGLTDSLPPTAQNYPEQQRRDYRTSHITPFTGNVLAVLYRCQRGEPFQTIFYQAEEIVSYPGCSVGLCDWKYIKERFNSFISDGTCTDQAFCLNKSGSPSLTPELFITFSSISFLLLRLR